MTTSPLVESQGEHVNTCISTMSKKTIKLCITYVVPECQSSKSRTTRTIDALVHPQRQRRTRSRDQAKHEHGTVWAISSSSYARTDSSADSSDATFSPGFAVAAFRRHGELAALPALLNESRSTGAAVITFRVEDGDGALSALSVLARLASSDIFCAGLEMKPTAIDGRLRD